MCCLAPKDDSEAAKPDGQVGEEEDFGKALRLQQWMPPIGNRLRWYPQLQEHIYIYMFQCYVHRLAAEYFCVGDEHP